MNVKKFREVIKERKRIAYECCDEWSDGIEQCWQEEIKILMEDLPSSILFLKTNCTADEYSWISEVIDDIAEQTGSDGFIKCYKELMTKFPEESEKYNIARCVEYAENILSTRIENEKYI